ncbi:MAG: type II CRISPR RNA-guided endonuclease Cas9 [Bacteroidales bacterium]|jgi:CRISPR-associated endonuclease Csn1|nr:type II CRISPR RNA-guided endonuclease Cas9 [Bacteroidales bacterium]
MKKILGLDLGTNSIGWALVDEAENDNEKSSIIKLGVRIINYDNFVSRETGKEIKGDPADYYRAGKGVSPNAARTQSRSMRRNLQRYKLRRENLIEILKKYGFISDETILSENGNRTTFETYRLRAKAAIEEISLEELARVLLMINKKRGYKSSRKAKGAEEGMLIDGMEVAKKLYNENLTPGQFCLQLLQTGNKYLPDFYRSDLQTEFDKIWAKQKEFYPEILTDDLKEDLRGKKREAVWAICAKHFIWKEKHIEWNNDEGKNIEVEKEHILVGIKREGKREEQNKENLFWRSQGLSEQLSLEQLVIVLQEISTKINGSSGYLGNISDRSKELFFNKIKAANGNERPQTVGEYQMSILDKNPNASLKNMVFYRQDYLDEFNTLWETQAKFHKELTNELKHEIRDIVIFYQRRLKSQKGLISFCEFESRQIEVEIDGKKKTKTVGSRVIPRSSPLFQEFKIWQRLNDIEVFPANEKNKKRKPNARRLEQDEKELLFAELSIIDKLSKDKILTLLDLPEFDMNFNSIDGNKTQAELFKAYKKIIDLSDYIIDDDSTVENVEIVFSNLGINTDILRYSLPIEIHKINKKNEDVVVYEECEMYKLYHLLYSFEGDKTNSGDENLISKLKKLYGFEKDYAKILAGVEFQSDYGSLSAKAITKILPLMKMGQDYTTACANIYERHSANSLTTDELEKKVYKNKLDILPKNSLHNPVVEKILNQMVNVVNAIITDSKLGKPDEIRIELARDLKKSADERFLLTDSVKGNTEEMEKIHKKLKEEFGINNPSRNDVIRYKLWNELALNGHKSLYSNKEISPAILFSKEVDIEHIIPQSRLFDDSFSNKTLEFKDVNIEKGNRTAIDYVSEKYGEQGLQDYLNRIISIFGTKTTRKVITNRVTGSKSVKSETKTFDTLQKEYIKSLKKKQREEWERLSENDKTLRIINKYFSNKLKKLVITENELPEGFIERDLGNTQYITKKAKTMLGDLVKFVISTTGSITDRLRDDWQLVDVMKEINFPKYEQLGLVENEERIDYETGEVRNEKKIKDWTKRNDHRHHAMDALTVAFTKRQFIQYLNNLNARRTDENMTISNTEKEEYDNFAITTEDTILNTRDVLGIEHKELYRDKRNKLRFKPPIPLDDFRAEAKRHLENTLISIKAKNKVVTKNVNTTKKKTGVNKKTQQTPRGQLHLETIYSSQKQYVVKEETVNAKFDEHKILTVTKPIYKVLLLKRLQENGNDPQKAFTGKNSLAKKPIFIDGAQTERLPEKVKTVTLETVYSIRKEISPDLKIDKVIDVCVRKILENRLKEFGNDPKKAFSNLDENPILNKNGKSIKRVTISGISNAESLHDKRDKDGKLLFDKSGKKQPVDFVNTGNNHHVAVYQDAEKNLQENVVSFFEVVARRNAGLPIIDKEYRQSEGWHFLFSMKQNEYFVFPNEKTGFNPNEVDLLNPDNYALISPNLFRVQKFSFKNYVFRHHLETTVAGFSSNLKNITWTDFRSSKGLNKIVKVRVNHIGQIVSIGEY